jgi:hypothetical protein
MKSKRLLSTLFFFVALCVVAQASLAQEPAGPQKLPAFTFTKDMTVYVSDFDLDAQNVQVDKGLVIDQVRPGILERPSKRAQKDPAAQAKKLVNTMSESIVKDLQKAGYKAQLLMNDEPKSSTGSWVHGVFTQVDEGNRRRRAIIGFGSGEAKMELFVTLTDLASPTKPLYETAQEGTSRGKPGTVITLNPYVAAQNLSWKIMSRRRQSRESPLISQRKSCNICNSMGVRRQPQSCSFSNGRRMSHP